MLDDGRAIPFDYAILAPGVAPAFGSVPGASQHAIPMKTPLDAARLRNNLLRSLSSPLPIPNIAIPA